MPGSMNKILLILLLIAGTTYAQEICDNAIDDDGDGLIDLNDDECECEGFTALESLIPNHSFEERSCCPTTLGQMTCADTWIQASGATSDYFNTCGIESIGIFTPPDLPLPGEPGGEGYVGFYAQSLSDYNEYVGACLSEPMIAGTTYILNLFVARANGDAELELTIFGTPNCGDLPWAGTSCPVGSGDWELLTTNLVSLPTAGVWQEVSLTFTPTVDIYAVSIGGSCTPGDGGLNYYYADELTLLDIVTFYGMESTGGWCSGDLELIAETDTVGGTWQWYRNGVALLGETANTINPVGYGEGEFTAVYSLDDYCEKLTYNSPSTGVEPSFDTESFCFPGVSTFSNTTVYDPDTDEITWHWLFGDGTESFEFSPTHEYDDPGFYDVSLITVSLDSSCNDTTTVSYVISATPEAAFDVTSDGLFTWAGHEVVCAHNAVNFIDESMIPAPWEIVAWDWDFGDGSTSTEEDPTHVYTEVGIYDITLTVETESGCTHTTIYTELYVTEVTADFTVTDICLFDEAVFENTSSLVEPGDFDTWEWLFGDGFSDFTEDATHIYDTPGTYTVELIATTLSGCKDTAEYVVTVHDLPEPQIEFIADGISSEDGGTGGCYTSPVQFNDLTLIDPPSFITSWNWDFGDGETSTEENPIHLYDEEGPYTVTLTVESDFGCTNTTTIDILMTNGLATISPDTTICQNGIATVYASGSEGSTYTYDWSIPGSDDGPVQTIEDLTEDYWVYVTATNESGCISPMDSILITVLDPITLEISLPDTACIGESSGATVTVAGGNGDYDYDWTANGSPLPDNSPVISTNPLETTVYCVTVSDGCETSPVDICTETYVPEPVQFTSDTTQGCEPTTITFTDLTGPDPELNETTWYIDGETYFGNPVSHTFTEAGTYPVALDVLSPEGCVTSASDWDYITIHPKPDPRLYATPNPTTYFNTQIELVNITPNINSSFEWYMPGATPETASSDSLVEVTYPELKSGFYDVWIIETTQYGCIDSNSIEIVITNDQIIYAPNIFTPDGDNFNDTWRIYIEGVDIYDFHLMMFNRWGEMVWESYNPSAAWDGTYGNGGIVQDGTYVWVIQAKDLENDKAYKFEGVVNVLK